jgi:hypothetical protein
LIGVPSFEAGSNDNVFANASARSANTSGASAGSRDFSVTEVTAPVSSTTSSTTTTALLPAPSAGYSTVGCPFFFGATSWASAVAEISTKPAAARAASGRPIRGG